MFGSSTLDVAIGLVLVYLMLGLTVTAINEAIATVARSRAKHLEQGIISLLQGKNDSPWVKSFFSHPLVAALGKEGATPSYVPSNTFAIVLIQLVRDFVIQRGSGSPPTAAPGVTAGDNGGATKAAGVINADLDLRLGGKATFDQIASAIRDTNTEWLIKTLLPLLENARADVRQGMSDFKKFTDQIEMWFDHGMDRVGGWYKRNTQIMVVLISAALVIAVNADTVAILSQLSKDGALRSSLVETAKRTTVPEPTEDASLDKRIGKITDHVKTIEGLGIPLGWHCKENLPQGIAAKCLGLLVTIFAASLGAPFWFDVLNKFMAVRGSGKAPEEKPKDPKRVPQPTAPHPQ